MKNLANDHAIWLAQAIKARDEALALMRQRFRKDLAEATELGSCNDPKTVSSQVEYANELTESYLAESERMFELMSKLAQEGLLDARQKP